MEESYFYNMPDLNNFVFEWNYTQVPEECTESNKANPMLATFMIFIVVLGLLGNILVGFTLIALKEYRKSITNRYYLHLTIADSLFLLMLPFSAVSEISGKWDFPLYLCKFKEALLFINYYASIYFLVVMSFDRYLAVTKAFSSKTWIRKVRSPLTCHILSLVGWILSLLLCVPLFQHSTINACGVCVHSFPENVEENFVFSDFTNQLFPNDHDDWTDVEAEKLSLPSFYETINDSILKEEEIVKAEECRLPKNKTLQIWIYGSFFGAFILPLVLICYFYGTILKALPSTDQVEATNRQRLYRRRVTMAVLALIGLFLVSWLPWYVEKLTKIRGLPLSANNCRKLATSVRSFAYLNSALNPYIYSFWRTNVKQRVSKISSRFRIWLPCTIKRSVREVNSLKIKQSGCMKRNKSQQIPVKKISIPTPKTEGSIV